MQYFGAKAGQHPQKHSSRTCNLYEDYDCYVAEPAALVEPARENAWESVRAAILHDSDHFERLRRSLDDGGLKIGYTNMSLKEVWLTPNLKEMIRKVVTQNKNLMAEEDVVG